MAAAAGPPSSEAPSPGPLNLNDEVVKMRKKAKRIRVLVIRKLVRTVARLKSKKGNEDALSKNQRRAQRLLEEIHAMKGWQSVEQATVMPVNPNKSRN